MDSLNYNHLHYFWTVARLGSISRAAAQLEVSQPTISEQLRKLEQTIGARLFERVGRGLRLTDAGQNAFEYAEKIFHLGREMTESLQGHRPSPSMRLAIGIVPSVPNLLAYQLISPALKSKHNFQIISMEDHAEVLYARLAVQQLDVVLSDSMMPRGLGVRGHHHLLRRSGFTFFSTAKLRPKGDGFPANLDGIPLLLPHANTRLHQALGNWFETKNLRPRIIGEFSGSTLLEMCGEAGAGCFAAPSIIEREIRDRYRVEVVGRTRDIRAEFYAITSARRVTHPGVLAIVSAAKRQEGA